MTVTAQTYTATVVTNCGTITLSLDAAKAPHTVNSFAFLAEQKYYDNTRCHRITTVPSLSMLQCGDPKGNGTGGPGYTIAEENLDGATYPAGTIAMAKTSAPHSTGSQFFLVYADSQLPPLYTPFGTITGGLDILQAIGAAGSDNSNGNGDGAPNVPVSIESITVAPAS